MFAVCFASRVLFFFLAYHFIVFFKRLFGASVLLFYYTNIIVSFRYNYKDEDLKKPAQFLVKLYGLCNPCFGVFCFHFLISSSINLCSLLPPFAYLDLYPRSYFSISLFFFFFKQASRLNVLRVLFASKILYHKIM